MAERGATQQPFQLHGTPQISVQIFGFQNIFFGLTQMGGGGKTR